MKFILITFFFFNFTFQLSAQQQKITYYKDIYLNKETDEKKAKFKKIESYNGVETNVKIFDLTKNCLLKEENYTNNIPSGHWFTFFTDCSLDHKRDFSKLVYIKTVNDSLFDNIIKDGNPDNCEIAQFGENEEALFKYLIANLKYPTEAKEAGISGKVYLQFLIKADGTVKVLSILRSANPFLDYQAWEVIEQMPNWKPAKKNGKPVHSYFTLPISFSLK